ncbi:MAG: hypothetical protein HY042_11975, partial [Spirochaetia bacterium]|nr:hypothetical protein [Spirochaetia bacterium]
MTRADEANIGALVKAEKWDKAYRECALLKEMGQATPGILYLGCFA